MGECQSKQRQSNGFPEQNLRTTGNKISTSHNIEIKPEYFNETSLVLPSIIQGKRIESDDSWFEKRFTYEGESAIG